MSKENASLNKMVIAVCLAAGWEVWSNYSDKRKDGTRRLSYMRNGYRIPKRTKQTILKDVTAALDANKIAFVQVHWHVSDRGGVYGEYDKLVIIRNEANK